MRVNYQELIDEAIKGRKNSYSPYSKFKVGAAVLTEKGIYKGCNVETASYGLTMCAERVAIFSAISDGCKQIHALAVVGDLPNGITTCGACREVMSEFNLNMEVIVSDTKKKYRVTTLKELLPESFGTEFNKYHEQRTKNS